ncbi:hypothetical protein MXB_1616, partial [Myxobolus squamalis]
KKIPLKYDWTQKGVVSSVQDQLFCASGYAFSAVGAIESQSAIKTGNLKDLSVQEIIDCSYNYRNYACDGGNPENLIMNKGNDEDNLLRSLFKIGPMSIAIDAAHEEFFFYGSGIIDISHCNPKNLNHYVLAVGYSLLDTPYLFVKNSFGKNWGINGYFKIALNKKNTCGISSKKS